MIILIYYLLSKAKNPYSDVNINRIEQISSAVLFTSILLCVFIYNNAITFWKIICVIVLIIINLFFIVNIIFRILG